MIFIVLEKKKYFTLTYHMFVFIRLRMLNEREKDE